MDTEIRQVEFARLTGVSKQAINEAIKAGRIAINEKTRHVLFGHELTQLWFEKLLAKRGNNPNVPGKIAGNEPKDSLIALHREKIIEEIGKIKADKRLKELQYAQKRDTLIEKETVAKVLFQYLDALNINLLDTPDMVIDTVTDKISAGGSRGEIIKIMRVSIQKAIIATKINIKDRLNQAI